ncbi:hypothetical protein JHK85_052649 [Glycine max]|nr:hypothetical protein JHK87_051696 [Glycine soja]KAG4937730.1 hypothetical protein JHK85_052649 [Glycine max]
MASSMMSSPAVTTVNRSSMVAPFTGLKSMAGFPQGFVYRENHRSPEYNDGRYWTMWKLPMIGCTDSAQVLKGVDEAVKAYPTAFVRIIGFDNVRQVQCIIFIAYKSPGY